MSLPRSDSEGSSESSRLGNVGSEISGPKNSGSKNSGSKNSGSKNSGSEISRLVELMPASGRMYCKIVSNASQSKVIAAKMPLPRQETRPIQINLSLWEKLTQPQRDLLLLRTVSWLTAIRWFKPSLFHGLAVAGMAITGLELLQSNAAAAVTFAGLTTLAIAQIWREHRSNAVELAADEKAVQIAQRRGYTQAEAASALAEAIEAVAQIEGHPNLSFDDLLRCQNLRQLALSPAASPASSDSSPDFSSADAEESEVE